MSRRQGIRHAPIWKNYYRDERTLRPLALEKELDSLHRDAIIDETTHKGIIAINEALKDFKNQFRHGNVPTSSDIRGFIKEYRYFKPDQDPWDHGLVIWAQDAVVCYLIVQLRKNLSIHGTAKVLSHTENGNTPLILDMIDNLLWKSAVLTMISGIDPNHYGRTYEAIARQFFSIPEYNFRDSVYIYVGPLLDLCAIYFKDSEQYFTLAYSPSTTRSDEMDTTGTSTTSELIGRFLGRKLGFKIFHRRNFQMTHCKTSQFSNDSFHWYHLPFTNGSMVQILLHTFLDDAALDIFHEQFRLSAISPGDPYLTSREHMYWASRERHQTKPTPGNSSLVLRCNTVTVFPTVMLTTLLHHNIKRNEYVETRQKLSTRTGGTFSDSCMLHLERTLDEAYFPGLDEKELAERNKNQTVSQEYAREDLDKPLVIIPQLWLWKFGDVLIFAHGVPRTSEHFFSPFYWLDDQLPVSYWQVLDKTLFTGESISPKYYVARLISQYITSFGGVGITRSESVRPGEIVKKLLQGLSYSEKSLHEGTSEPCEECNSSITARVKHQDLPILDYFERHVVRVLTRVKQYMERAERTQIDYEKEKQFNHDLSDCRSDLAMILHILKQQKNIITAFRDDVEQDFKLDSGSTSRKTADTAALRLLGDCLITLNKYEERVFKIDGDAERVEKSVQDLLNLKRTYTSAQYSHAGVLLGVAAGAFAVVTIFFAPLAFLTAFFALNIQGFERLMITEPKEVKADAPGLDRIYSGGKMAGIFVGSVILTFVITGTLVFAGMKWLNIDIKDLKFERGNSEEEKVNPTIDKEEETLVEPRASTSEQRRDSSIRETSPEKAKKTGLAAAFSVARKRLLTK